MPAMASIAIYSLLIRCAHATSAHMPCAEDRAHCDASSTAANAPVLLQHLQGRTRTIENPTADEHQLPPDVHLVGRNLECKRTASTRRQYLNRDFGTPKDCYDAVKATVESQVMCGNFFEVGSGYCFCFVGDCAETVTEAGEDLYEIKVTSCGNAMDLSSRSSPYSGSTVGSPNDVQNDGPPCDGTSNGAGTVILYHDVQPGYFMKIRELAGAFDNTHALRFGGDCPGMHAVTCHNDPDTSWLTWTNTFTQTQRVYFIISGHHKEDEGTFGIQWSVDPGCENIDNGAVDSNMRTCAGYGRDPAQYDYDVCGNADHDGFRAATLCCACGGGSVGALKGVYAKLDHLGEKIDKLDHLGEKIDNITSELEKVEKSLE